MPLTELERARLRPTVDAAALERWLIATNDELRVAMIAHFANSVTSDDLRAITRAIGESADELAALLERAPGELLPPPGALRVPGPGAPPNAVAYIPVPSEQNVVMVEPPDDPTLALLWNAIEPTR